MKMKQKLTLLFAFVLAMTQGFAMPLDSLMTFVPCDKGSVLTIEKNHADDRISQFFVETVITVDPSSLDFGTVSVGRSVTRTFRVKGFNLTGPLTLNVVTSRSATSDGFTINRTSITAGQAARGATVTVTFKPLYEGTYSTTMVTISGGGVESKTVTLSGIAVNSPTFIDSSKDHNDNDITKMDEFAMNSRIYADGHSIIIESPVDQEAIISDITGRAQRVSLQAGRNEIPVNASGVYIVRIKEKTVKLMLK